MTANSPGYTLDQIGWQTVAPSAQRAGGGGVLSLRQFKELRDLLERGRVVVKSSKRSKTYPS